jgi:transcriptional antiterminator NusG
MGLDNNEFDYLEEKRAEVVVEEKVPEKEEEKVEDEGDNSLFVVKVATNKEARAFELIADRVKSKGLEVYSVAKPHGLRGYIFLEAKDKENAEEASFNLPYVKGIIPKRISYKEIKPMIEPITAEINIERDDIVEIIAEPFKKEKAKVVRVDKAKGEVVVSLLGAIIPIPVTVRIDNVRVVRREDMENS